jgi:hypothetical protein
MLEQLIGINVMKLRAGNKEFENNLKMTLNIAINLENRSKEIE